MNSIFFNEIEDAKCIKIYLRKKINEKALNDTLIKLGLTSLEFANSKGSEKYYYFELEEERSYAASINYVITWNYIKVDVENSCICINYPKYYNYISNHKSNILFKILNLLIRENIITKKSDNIINTNNIGNISNSTSLIANMANFINSAIESYEIPKQNVEDIIEKIKLGKDIGNELHYHGRWMGTGTTKNLIENFIKFLMDKYKEELSLSENNSKNETKKEEVKEQNKELNIEKLNPIIKQCENKINEIKEIIKDFDYSDKKTYEEATSKIEKDLEELENKDISVSGVNEIIDEINETYRNAYKKKNNVSALSYIMETDEDIDLIKKIDIDNL